MYQCKVCGKQLKTKCGYVKHELAHTATFKCHRCGKQYRRKETLVKHSEYCKEVRQFTCSCGQYFQTQRELLRHNESHGVQKVGQRRSALNDNVEIHTLYPVGIDKLDLIKFLANTRPVIEKYLLSKVRQQAIKWYIVAQVELTREDRDGNEVTVVPYFRSVTYTLLTEDTFENHDLNQALQKLALGLEKYIHESSGWTLKNVKKLDIHTVRYKPLGGSSYLDLPKSLINGHMLLNIKNKDDKCFVWAVLAHIHKTDNTQLGLLTLGEYSDLYLKTDVLLLTDIFENFRDISMRDYRLDPCHYYSAPWLSWSAMLLMTKAKLKLITEIDDLLLWERACRGGVNQISCRYAKANNPYLEDYDPCQPNSFIVFIDSVNLYGWGCQQNLPIGGFRRLTLEEIASFDVLKVPDDGEKGYLIEVSLSYPSDLHDDHNCFPLAPIKRNVRDNELSPYARNAWNDLRGSVKRAKSEKTSLHARR